MMNAFQHRADIHGACYVIVEYFALCKHIINFTQENIPHTHTHTLSLYTCTKIMFIMCNAYNRLGSQGDYCGAGYNQLAKSKSVIS